MEETMIGRHLSSDAGYMRRAIELARRGEGFCHPNPMVGAVLVKDGVIIGEGYHERYGGLHAERNAIRNCTVSPEGATLYVTLEPCCHHGKQPPCTDALLENKIARVFVGSRDPNPLVSGKGVRILREHGVEVTEDFLREECDRLNPVFFHFITTGLPYVRMKYAMTADGKIATKTGASRWITGEMARQRVQEMRHASMGIMAGIGTVLADDPLLTCRLPGGKSPVRILCDTNLHLPLTSQIARTAKEYRTIDVCGADPETDPALADQAADLREAGVEILSCPLPGNLRRRSADRDVLLGTFSGNLGGENTDSRRSMGVDLASLMRILGGRGIDSILLEGGGTLNESALTSGIVDEIDAFVAPKIFGGKAKTPVEGIGVSDPALAVCLEYQEVEVIGEDLLIRYLVRKENR
jgi:diaminohydroxyphosphoribosylaminopyrimidine deaminase/5-amino-6-(5-phosphoribosylamino)uracil reductase